MWFRNFLLLVCFLLALAVASEVKGEGPGPMEGEGLPVVPVDGIVGEKLPKHNHAKEPKHPKHPKEKKHKKHKDPKEKHPKEDEPIAAAASATADEEAAPAPAETEAEETAKRAAAPARLFSFPMNTTEATVEDEAQKEACGPCCGMDLKEVASKLPFVNRK